jgi:hypothetical protein
MDTHSKEQIWRFIRVAVAALIPVLISDNLIPTRWQNFAMVAAALITGGLEVAYRSVAPVVKANSQNVVEPFDARVGGI